MVVLLRVGALELSGFASFFGWRWERGRVFLAERTKEPAHTTSFHVDGVTGKR